MDLPLLPECDEYSSADGLFEDYPSWYDPDPCEGDCLQTCEVTLYKAKVIKVEIDEETNRNALHIYFPSGQTEVGELLINLPYLQKEEEEKGG